MQTYDTHGSGYKCSELLTIRILGYADDAALIEPRVDDMTCRLTMLADASCREADMDVRMDKTFSQHVCRRAAATITTAEAIAVQVKFKHKCDFCDRRFQTITAMQQHRESCVHNYEDTDQVFEIEKIVNVFGHIKARWFLVKYVGYPEP